MPMAAPKPCTYPGCRALVRDGTARCELHRRKETGFTRKQSRHERGYGTSWDKLRLVVLQRDGGLCQPCLVAGRVTVGNIVDHKTNKAQGGTDDDANLQTICKPCHTNKTALESARGGVGASMLPEWLPSPRIPVLAVCGPPGSGKTTYVREHAQPGELVLDLDEIAAELTGKPLYAATREEGMAAVRVRNKRLADLADSACPYPRAWLIVTAGSFKAREFWARKLGQAVHVMNTPKAECIRRINADDRRPAALKRQVCEAVLQWE